ncbi:PrgH/EprH family type III secretion apparatus protein [Burkholderia ubonensis]|uniref:PrgH/EprH family type III secretion apparatus protein n=1 Tax=Burkholderia ubonensis TaxID=101571 RepID=UPI00075DB77D|nr:PrgH/EprH family type III secretion apparatus protein [Burkholderia ubonensis]KWK77695.1 type III secretion protein [Burkholderia ubonensis]
MIENHPKQEIYHLKILFGPLFGSDIMIAGDEVFFCVGGRTIDSRATIRDDNPAEFALERAAKALYIPYQDGQPNFRLRFVRHSKQAAHLSNTLSLTDFEAEFLSEDSHETRFVAFNSVCRVGEIAFAVKRQADDWNEAVLSYTAQPTCDEKGATNTPVAGSHCLVGDSTRRFAFKLGALVLIGIVAAGLAYWQVQRYVNTQKLASVNGVLTSAPVQNTILPGNDGKIYVLSASQDGVEWDRQALHKAALPEKIEVVTVGNERDRLEQRLDEMGIQFVTIRLDTPMRPVLVVASQMTPAARQHAKRCLKLLAPYATAIDVDVASVAEIEQQARNLLDQIGARYRQSSRPGGATFEVGSSIGDEQLAALRNLIRSFSRKWGVRCVDFKIALHTNWLKGKSYREGGDGYVLLDHASWYFPQPLEGAYSR